MTLVTSSRVQAAVEIRSPFPHHALPRMWKWLEESRRQVSDAFSPKTLDEFVAYWEHMTRAGQRSWGVWRDGELGGSISSMQLNPVVADAHCIFKRTFWGHGTTAEALRLVFAEIFVGGAQKITTLCFADNHALLGLVRKVGFQREGRLRKNALRDGQLIDQMVIGLTRDDFQTLVGQTPAGLSADPVNLLAKEEYAICR